MGKEFSEEKKGCRIHLLIIYTVKEQAIFGHRGFTRILGLVPIKWFKTT